jgi:RNA polymerase primary sigma factor
VEAVTGAGKTRMALQAMVSALDLNHGVAVLVPTIELMRQWAREISVHVQPRFNGSLRIEMLGGGGTSDLGTADVLVATSASAARYRLLPPGQTGLLIADECHHYGAESWSNALEPDFEARLGLTATYLREDSGVENYLDPYFGGVCYRVGYEEALADGVIAPFRIAFVGVAFSSSERDAYEEAADKAGRYRRRLVSDWGVPPEPFGEFMRAVQGLRHAGVEEGSKLAGFYLSAFSKRRQIMAESVAKQGRVRDLSPAVADAQRTIVFAQTVRAAQSALQELRLGGHVGSVIEATMDHEERAEAFEAFERGDYNVVAAPRLLDEGVDVPAADLAIVLATSRSRRQLIQRMGRVVRKKADGRSARLAIMFVEGTAEDPTQGAHEDFLDEVIDVAEDVAVFRADAKASDIVGYLRPYNWSRPPSLSRPEEPTVTDDGVPQTEGASWLSDLLIDLESVKPGCILRHPDFGVGTVLAVDGSRPQTVLAEFRGGAREIILGAGHLEFEV